MFVLALIIFGLMAIASASPAGVKDRKGKKVDCVSTNFNNPWTVRDIFMWQPLPTTNTTNGTDANAAKGSIDFMLFDSNKDLQLMTECTSELNPDGNTIGMPGYVPCGNSPFWFQFNASVLLLERMYVDPCLGDPPYDRGNAYGQGYANLSTRLIPGFGVVGTKVRLEIPITSLT